MSRIGTICLVASLVLPSFAFAQEAKEIKAVVQEVDASVGTITVLLGDTSKSRQLKTLNLAKPDLPVTDALGKPIALVDLQQDQRVFLKMALEDVAAIRLAPPYFYGTILEMDASKRTLVLKSGLGNKTVEIPAEAKIIYANQPAKFDDIKTGFGALLYYSSDKKTLVEIKVGKTVQPDVKLSKSTGILIELDRDKKAAEIFLSTSSGDHFVLWQTGFTPETTFGLSYQSKPFREITAAEVKRGLKIVAWTNAVTRKLAHLEIEMPILSKRAVKAFDPAKRQITLDDDDGDLVMELAPTARVLMGKGTAALKDIAPGRFVSCGLSADRRFIEMVVIAAK